MTEEMNLADEGDVRDHVIVCGFDEVGKHTVKELVAMGKKVMVISTELTKDDMNYLSHHLVGFVLGDPTDENVLKEANIETANTLITTLVSVGDNVFVALTARDLNPNIRVIARVDELSEPTKRKFEKAGANRIVSPFVVAGHLLARAGIQPNSVDFLLDAMTSTYGIEVQDIRIPDVSGLIGKSLAELELKKKTGVTVVGIKKAKELILNPSEDTLIEKGDSLVVVGREAEIQRIEDLT
jgi:voltage-gated potassium channel